MRNLLKPAVLAIGSLATTFSAATDANAQTISSCAPRQAVVDKLTEKYGETRQSLGVNRNILMMEVFANNDTGTWTVITTNPNGIACVRMYGDSFEALISPDPQGKPAAFTFN